MAPVRSAPSRPCTRQARSGSAPAPCRSRRGMAPPAMAMSWRGVTSSRTARAGGRSASSFTMRPVSTRPPRDSSSDSSAAMMAPLPPSTTGHPTWWAMAVKSRGKTPESGAVRGSIEWAAVPATRARPSSVENRSAIRFAELSPRSPNPAAASGCAGTERMEPRNAGRILSRSRTSGVKMRVVLRSVRPERAGDALDAVPDADGAPTVQRVGEGDRRGQQPDAVRGEIDLGEGGGGEQQRVYRGADVVAKAGERQLGCAAAPAGLIRRLVDVDRHAGARQGEGCDEPVGAGTDDDRVCSPHGCVTAPMSFLRRRR